MLLYLLTWVILLCFFILLYDSNRFRTVSYEIQSDKLKEAFCFVFLSDLHGKVYGKENERLLQEIDRLHPDAVFVGGDLLTAKPNQPFDSAVFLLEKLKKRYPVCYANGNHEHRLVLYPEKYHEMASEYENKLNTLGIKRLINEKESFENANFDVVGSQIERVYYKRFHKIPMMKGYLEQLLPERSKDRFTILLAHNPEYFEQYKSWGADLVLSGHVHGGVARLPFFGGVISPDLRLFPKYDGGLYHIGKSQMIVSRGLGAHTIPFRFLNPGELVFVSLLPKKSG